MIPRNHRSLAAWALLLALAASLAVSPISAWGSSPTEERNIDSQADVWPSDDEDGDLVRMMHDRNADDDVDARKVTPQPFLLPTVVFVGDAPVENRAPVTLETSSASRPVARPSGRAPPASF